MVDVVFLARLGACSRMTVPVEVRWRFRLEAGRVYTVRTGKLFDREFHARLMKNGQFTVPSEVVAVERLKKRDLLNVTLEVES
jgi:bifunctional DNA-binding transcriptional regulator/antitoxin component of YhaV-PrlF toxin-antitoxin module